MRLAMRKAMAAVLACALILNLLTLINPGMERAGAEPAPLWVKQSSQSLSAIAYGNGIYVGLTTDNNNPKIVTSTDLVNWEEQIIVGHTKPFKTVKFLNGQFVIGSLYYDKAMAGETFLYSSDGVHWTGATANEVPQFNISSIAYGGGNYVAGTTFGQMITSADGISWTSAVYRMSIINEMQYLNGHFIAAGFAEDMGPPFGKATILTSANGVTWHETMMGDMTPSTAAALKSIASDGQTMVTGGYTGVYRLSAGNLNQPNITTEKIDEFDYNYSINKMVYTQNDGGLFIIVGSNGTIHTSPDSYTWTNESIIGATAEFSDVIEVGNSVVAVGSIGVYKRLGQVMDSELTPATGSFDKNMANQADITATLTLNGNTLFNIYEGSYKLRLDTDYTISAAGDEVVLKKEYLAALPVGTANLTFKFTGGADQTMVITVSDSTPQNSTISPTTASFDKNASAQSDVTTTLTLNGNTLFNIYEGSYKLRLDTDYTISAAGDEVVLKKEYLATLPVGTATLTFKFTGGADQAMAITVSDSTPQNSTISPITASFDKNASAQSDVTTALTLNGNTLGDITYSGQALMLDTDYTVTSNTVTIKKEYLATLPSGTATLTFRFSAGSDQPLTISISDSSPNNSTINPSTAAFDKKASAQADVSTTLTLNGNDLIGITHGGQELVPDTDYTITDNTVTIRKDYLAAQPVGVAALVFRFSAGSEHALTITISDSTPSNSEISPTTATFDKKPSAQKDVAATLTLNGNTLTGVSLGVNPLELNKDYSVTDNTVTIKKSFLAAQPVGTTVLTFQFSAGSDDTLAITIVNTTPSSPPSSGGNETAPPEPNKAADIYVNGQVVSAGTAKESTRNNQSVLTIIVDQAKLAERLDSEGQNPVITILMSSKSDIAAGQLTGNMVKDMENKNATLELKTDNASYFLPASQIDIDGIQSQLGGSVSLQDVVIHIEMAKPVQEMASIVENAAKQGEFAIVAAPVDFTVSASYQSRIVEVTQFSAYVQRQIALPEGVLREGITTGIVVEPDGSVRHVPTKVIVAEGRYYAQINSLTNSTYAVIWHPVEFADAAGHWAKDAINDMGSRMIVDGRGDGSFKPNEAMTRAEFAAILVRGLGLKLSEGKAPFSDVDADDWYNSAIATAHAYQLISGYEDGTFRPNDKLTRQQAMVMIAKAMKLTQLKDKLPVQHADELLQAFGLANTSGWAKQSIADCIQADIIVGKSGSELALQDNITRAEVAVMIQRLLENSDLI